MKITVCVKLKSKSEKVELLENGDYLVRTSAQPVDGKANQRIIELLAKFFGEPKSSIELVSGQKGKKKVFKLNSKNKIK